jgi:hypothetical protein
MQFEKLRKTFCCYNCLDLYPAQSFLQVWVMYLFSQFSQAGVVSQNSCSQELRKKVTHAWKNFSHDKNLDNYSNKIPILTLCCWGCCSSSLLFRRSSNRLLSWSARVEVALAEGGEVATPGVIPSGPPGGIPGPTPASRFFLLWIFCISDKKDFEGGPPIGVGF